MTKVRFTLLTGGNGGTLQVAAKPWNSVILSEAKNPGGCSFNRSAPAVETSGQSPHSPGSDWAQALAFGSVLRGQQRISTAGNNAHNDRIDSQCDVSPYPCIPALPKKANTVNELTTTRTSCGTLSDANRKPRASGSSFMKKCPVAMPKGRPRTVMIHQGEM